MKKTVVITTERLVLRGYEPSDLDDLYEYGRDPYVAYRTGFEPHNSIEDTREVLACFMKNDKPHLWAIALKATGKVIGSAELKASNSTNADVREQERELGYTMNAEFHGNGYMTEAVQAVIAYGFKKLKLFLLRVRCSEFNAQSRRVIEKCGFRYDGISRYDHVWKYDGKLHSMLNYSLTADEWKTDIKKERIL